MVKHEQAMMLKLVPLFHDLNAQELERVEEITMQRFFNKKTVIFTEGSDKEAVFFIREGLVKAYKTDENGHEQIVSFLKTGDMFPHIGLFNRDPYPATTEAIVNTYLLAIPVRLFEQLLVNTPSIAIKVLRVMDAKIKELQEKLQAFTGQDVNHRALSFLLKLAEQHGEKEGNTVYIELPITHQEFANAVGTTRETINRLLNQLRKDDIIQTERNRITIYNIEALKYWKANN
jgi:CRP/FNR family cyclic AMP-dependent transcriptional regulator